MLESKETTRATRLCTRESHTTGLRAQLKLSSCAVEASRAWVGAGPRGYSEVVTGSSAR